VRIKTIRIRNFRGFSDSTIQLDALTSFVGPNGAGKSTVLAALNVFFRESSNATDVAELSEQDFHRKNTAEPVDVSLTFHELSESAKRELSHYVRNGELVVSARATFDAAKQAAKVVHFGSRLAMAAFAPFFRLHKDGAGAPEINAEYERLRGVFGELPANARSKDAKAEALSAYEAAHPELGVLLESEDTFYGIAGASKLAAYVQWVYVPAVKDATQEQAEGRDSALGKLLARTVRAQWNFKDELAALEADLRERYQTLLAQRQGALEAVSKALTGRLVEWCHPDAAVNLAWLGGAVNVREPTARASVSEGEFSGDLARFGHGFQRSYLMALLQELASAREAEADAPTLILGCEEPELYQHPPQARHLAEVFRTLSEANAQILLTTHSPYFVSGEHFEGVRMVRRSAAAGSASAHALTFARFVERCAVADAGQPERPDAAAARLGDLLRPQINELFFARGVVLVEGSEDAAYLMTWMSVKGLMSSFRQKGLHVVPVDGKSRLLRPLVVAQELGMPVFVAFDSDAHCSPKHRTRHESDNRKLLRLLGTPDADAFPADVVWHAGYAQWPTVLSAAVKADLVASIGDDALRQIKDRVRVSCGQASSLDKNALFVERCLVEAHRAGASSGVLDRWCAAVLSLH